MFFVTESSSPMKQKPKVSQPIKLFIRFLIILKYLEEEDRRSQKTNKKTGIKKQEYKYRNVKDRNIRIFCFIIPAFLFPLFHSCFFIPVFCFLKCSPKKS